MSLPASCLEMWEQLNDANQTQVNQFSEFLLYQQRLEKGQLQRKNIQPIHLGALKGKIRMLDHFDDPLPGF